MEINTHETPPNGGWMYRQPQTGFVIDRPQSVSMTHAQVVTEIVRHRLKNPAIAAKHKLSTDPAVVSDELMRFNRLRLGIPEPQAPQSFFQPSHSLPERVVAAAVEIRTAAHGAAAIIDFWNSKEPPVEKALAEKRASICAACPQNAPGSWFVEAPSEIIRQALASRGDLKLETAFDDKLQSCQVCKCLMKLKVWIGLDFILSKTKPEVMSEFPAHCWIARKDQ
jgi:hypothetical protein